MERADSGPLFCAQSNALPLSDLQDRVCRCGEGALGHGDRQDAKVDLCLHRPVVETVAEPQAELVIALSAFEMGSLPVYAHEVGFARDDK